MSERRQVLDFGYVRLVESWGSDERVIEIGRESVGGTFVSWEPYDRHPDGDRGLLRHLNSKKHTGPFEFAGLTVEARAPVAVVWQWVRHRTQSYAVMSSRYVGIPEGDYLPGIDRCMAPAGKNRQAGAAAGADELTEGSAHAWLAELESLYGHAESVYRDGLKAGVPKELARLALTFGRYFTFAATANLHNWLRFLALRMAPDSQHEIRMFAGAVGELVAEKFPRTWALFMEGR